MPPPTITTSAFVSPGSAGKEGPVAVADQRDSPTVRPPAADEEWWQCSQDGAFSCIQESSLKKEKSLRKDKQKLGKSAGHISLRRSSYCPRTLMSYRRSITDDNSAVATPPGHHSCRPRLKFKYLFREDDSCMSTKFLYGMKCLFYLLLGYVLIKYRSSDKPS